MIDVLIAELDRQLDALLLTIQQDLIDDGATPDQLSELLADARAQLVAHREIAIARLERSMLHVSQVH